MTTRGITKCEAHGEGPGEALGPVCAVRGVKGAFMGPRAGPVSEVFGFIQTLCKQLDINKYK